MYICCARLVELTGSAFLFSESGRTRGFSAREAAALSASPQLPDDEATNGNTLNAENNGLHRSESEAVDGDEQRAGRRRGVEVPPLAIEPSNSRTTPLALAELADAFTQQAAVACKSATAAFTPRTPANALAITASVRQKNHVEAEAEAEGRQRGGESVQDVEQRVMSHVQALNEGSSAAIRALLAETSHEVFVNLLALWLTQFQVCRPLDPLYAYELYSFEKVFSSLHTEYMVSHTNSDIPGSIYRYLCCFQNPIIQYQDYTLLLGTTKQPKRELTAIEAIQSLEKV